MTAQTFNTAWDIILALLNLLLAPFTCETSQETKTWPSDNLRREHTQLPGMKPSIIPPEVLISVPLTPLGGL